MKLNFAIFGAGLSGQAALRLAKARGHEVTLFDESGSGDFSAFVAQDLECFDRFVFSPGFAANHPWRLLVQESGKSIQSELGFAAEYWKGRMIGVTGTNGKSTLTRLLVDALRQAGKKAIAAGNIGQPLSDVVLKSEEPESTYAVCEISSFQAELTQGLELDALLWTNFDEDHLDRYETMTDYFKAKAGLFECLRPESICVIGPQVKQCAGFLDQPLDEVDVAPQESGLMHQLNPGSVFNRFPQSENFALATKYWRLSNQPDDALVAAADDFVLAPHRLSVVREKAGVTYWNDSKATNFHASLAALQSVPRPIIWLGGGRFKGGDLHAFAQKVSRQIDGAVLYGEVAPNLAAALKVYLDEVQIVSDFKQAVQVAGKLARALIPSHVLLSPGFSSFDQFKSYQARGKTFNSIVLGL